MEVRSSRLDVITEHRLRTLALDPAELVASDEPERAARIYEAFLQRVPYENLSNNQTVRAAPDEPESWPRATDRLLRENATWGLGGTSFSLAYALRDLLRGAGVNAHCTLGYNLVTEQAHAAVVAYLDAPVLFDPSLLMNGPIPVRPGGTLEDPLGTFTFVPRCGATLTVTLKVNDAIRSPITEDFAQTSVVWDISSLQPDADRPIYSIIPVPAPPHSFRQAWLASFYRGRVMPLRIARRVGDVIYRYGERPGSIEVLSVDGRSTLPLEDDLVEQLHRTFGIDGACLQAWFDHQ